MPNKEKNRARNRIYYLANKDKISMQQKKWYKENRERCLKTVHLYQTKYREKQLYLSCRKRAKIKDIEFDLELSDIIIPEYCPVLGIKLTGEKRDFSPSVDRFNNSKGYTKDNIRIISCKANRFKSDATAEELKAVVRYMEDG